MGIAVCKNFDFKVVTKSLWRILRVRKFCGCLLTKRKKEGVGVVPGFDANCFKIHHPEEKKKKKNLEQRIAAFSAIRGLFGW